jgi:16S rRNA (cytidine1402-2'-O)-methyltransferase
VAALVASGLPTSRFVFEGFLPRSGAARRARLATVAGEERTVVLYEAPHRIERTLADLREACGPDRPAAIARELTKLYEQFVRGTLGDIEVGTPRGEYVVVIGPRAAAAAAASPDDLRAAVDAALERGRSTRQAAADVAASFGVPKRDAYALALERRTARANAAPPPSPATTNGV